MIVRLSPVLPKTRVGMSPAFNCEACAREAKLLLADASPAKMLPTNVLRFILPPDKRLINKQAIVVRSGNQGYYQWSRKVVASKLQCGASSNGDLVVNCHHRPVGMSSHGFRAASE